MDEKSHNDSVTPVDLESSDGNDSAAWQEQETPDKMPEYEIPQSGSSDGDEAEEPGNEVRSHTENCVGCHRCVGSSRQ